MLAGFCKSWYERELKPNAKKRDNFVLASFSLMGEVFGDLLTVHSPSLGMR